MQLKKMRKFGKGLTKAKSTKSRWNDGQGKGPKLAKIIPIRIPNQRINVNKERGEEPKEMKC